jgi:hypothetical protein
VPYAGSEDRNVRRILNRVLIEKGANFAIFSEMTLIFLQNYSDFDSAIPRFESWRPSQHSRP